MVSSRRQSHQIKISGVIKISFVLFCFEFYFLLCIINGVLGTIQPTHPLSPDRSCNASPSAAVGSWLGTQAAHLQQREVSDSIWVYWDGGGAGELRAAVSKSLYLDVLPVLVEIRRSGPSPLWQLLALLGPAAFGCWQLSAPLCSSGCQQRWKPLLSALVGNIQRLPSASLLAEVVFHFAQS